MSEQKIRQNSANLESRLSQVHSLLQEIDQEISAQESPDKIAPDGAWIVRYRAKGKGGTYWYYKWQSKDLIFMTKDGQKTRNKYIGKAGSKAFMEAVEMMKRRAKIESLKQVRHTLELALFDLIDEATKDKDSDTVSGQCPLTVFPLFPRIFSFTQSCISEERSEGKLSRSVLQTSRRGDSSA